MKSQDQELFEPQLIKPSLPLNHKQGKSFFADGLQYSTRQVCLSRHSLCFILPTGEWYRGLSFEKDSAVGLIFAPKFTSKYLISKIYEYGIKLLPNNQYLSFFDSWTCNHYHFHCDFLPRLFIISESVRKSSVLLLPDHNYIKKAGLSILNLLNLKFKEIVLLPTNRVHLILSKLLYVSKSHTSGYTNPVLMHKARMALNFNKVIPEKRKRLYIIRGVKYGRKVLNEGEVIQSLKDNFGFETIDFDQLTIREAIDVMQKTEILVGMHGAALTNMFYLPTGSHIIEFRFNGKHNNHCYWHLASGINMHYTAIFGESDDETKILEGRDCCNLTIPIQKLLSAVKQALVHSKP